MYSQAITQPDQISILRYSNDHKILTAGYMEQLNPGETFRDNIKSPIKDITCTLIVRINSTVEIAE